MAALERDPARRLASAAELAAGLKAYLRTNPIDRDDLSALMIELFPDDAAESERLEAQETAPGVATPTVMLPREPGVAAPAQRDPTPEIVAPVTAPRRRWPRLLVAVLALGTGGGVVVMRLRVPPADLSTVEADARVAIGAPDAGARVTDAGTRALLADVPAPVADAPAGPGVDAPAPIAVVPDLRPVPRRTRRDPRASLPPDAGADAPAHDLPERALGELSLAAPPGIAIRVDGPPACTLHSVPMRCHLPAGATYEFEFRVPGGATFKATLRAGIPLRKYAVDPARTAVDCVENC
jgi:hypothetical protein